MATERGELDQVVGDMNGFKSALQNRDLQLLIKSPIVNADKKLQIFDTLFGGKMSVLVLSFFRLVIKKGREAYLPAITDSFIEQFKISQGISTVQLKSTTQPDEKLINKIKSILKANDLASDKIELETIIDPSLLGGFVINIGDRQYDASVSSKLEALKKQFQGN